MNRLVSLLLRHRFVAVLLVVLGSFALGAFARPGVKNDISGWFVQGDPALATFLSFREQFGTDEVLVVAVEDGAPVASPARLAQLDALTRSVAAVDGLDRVQSLSNALAATEDAGAMKLAHVVEGKVEEDDVARAQAAIARGGLASRLVGKDGTTAILMAWLSPAEDLDAKRGEILAKVRQAVDAGTAGTTARPHLAGGGVVFDALNQLTVTDGALFIGLAYLVVLAAVYAATRRLLWTVVAVVAVTLADMALFGIISLSGHALNAVTISLPTIVMVLGVANIIHLARAVDAQKREKHSDPTTLVKPIAEVLSPTIFNALTTSAGFIALVAATMSVTQEFGAFSAIGVVLALVTTSVLTIAAAPYSLRRGKRQREETSSSEWLARFNERCVAHAKTVFVATVGVVALLAVGMTKLIVDTSTIGFLPDSHIVVADAREVERLNGPFIPLELSVRAPEKDGWKRASFLQALARAEAAVREVPQTGAPLSVVDVMADVRAGLRGEPVDRSFAPENDEDALGLLGFLDAVGLSSDIDPLIGKDGATARITVPIPIGTARELTTKAAQVEAVVQKAIGDAGHVSVTGYLPLYGRIVTSLVDDQIDSFFIAFFLVFGIIGLYLRSWRLLIVAIIPNVLPVALVLGAMGWLGIRLDVATMTIAATVLGIVVDDTVHTLHRLKLSLEAGATIDDALREAARTAGAANFASNAVLIAGFAILAFASVKTVGYVGLLSAVAVAGALIADLVLVPPLAWFLFSKRGSSSTQARRTNSASGPVSGSTPQPGSPA